MVSPVHRVLLLTVHMLCCVQLIQFTVCCSWCHQFIELLLLTVHSLLCTAHTVYSLLFMVSPVHRAFAAYSSHYCVQLIQFTVCCSWCHPPCCLRPPCRARWWEGGGPCGLRPPACCPQSPAPSYTGATSARRTGRGCWRWEWPASGLYKDRQTSIGK